MKFAKKMDALSSAIFAELAEKKRTMKQSGMRVIDMSVGSPDLFPAPHIQEALREGLRDPRHFRYAIEDLPQLRAAAARWYARRFGVALDPAREIVALMGSQDGLAHIAMTLCDEGDTVLVPDPCYPIFAMGPTLSGARVVTMPMLAQNDFLIDFDAIDECDARSARLMIVSYPNNPVTRLAPPRFYEQLVAFAKRYDIAVLHDNAYCELVFDGKTCGSFLSTPGAMDVGVELNSLSKTYNMAGCRIGFALGNAEMIAKLAVLKSHLDYGVFLPVQLAGIAALDGPQDNVEDTRRTYEKRRNVLVEGFAKAGWAVEKSEATMFIWAKVPGKWESSRAFAWHLMEQTGLIVTPGSAFGALGEGYVRLALVQEEGEIRAAAEAMEKSGFFR